ncbi:MAG TPA: hypothetical protein VMB20_00840 [Candidatus Acidoferrum sp.]|nr:hypothetical protein [Candidatus Acidoferrum sp.]
MISLNHLKKVVGDILKADKAEVDAEARRPARRRKVKGKKED